MNYLVIVEKGEHGYRAYVPDLYDCEALGNSEAEVLDLIRPSIALHLEMMREQGLPIPQPTTLSAYVDVPV
ncbi:MAG: type II toxin-antitoxin system HicB family antitoxin [Rhodothermales bacterium]